MLSAVMRTFRNTWPGSGSKRLGNGKRRPRLLRRRSPLIGRIQRAPGLSAFGISILVVLITALSHSAWAASGTTIRIGGVGSALGAMRLLGDAFETSHPSVRVNVLPSIGSAGAVGAVNRGAIDIGLTGRPLQERERVLGLRVFEYARSPFVFVSNMDVIPDNITLEMVAEIYRGEFSHWPDGTRVRPVIRPQNDSDTLLLQEMSPKVKEAVDIAVSHSGYARALTDQENADMIQKIPGSFGTSTLTQVVAEKRYLRIFRLEGVAPGIKTLADGSYRFYKRFFIVTRPAPSDVVGEFIAFLESPEGRKLLESSGNIVVKPTLSR